MKTVVINLIGGPGCGKSTVAADVFCKLKKLNKNVELVTEYVKDIVYDNNTMELADQLLISAQQNHRLLRLNGKVEFIICDASLLNGIVYNKYHNIQDSTLDEILYERFKTYHNEVFFLPRPETYSPLGRMQTLSDAIKIDELFVDFMNSNYIKFSDMRKTNPNDVSNIIVSCILDEI